MEKTKSKIKSKTKSKIKSKTKSKIKSKTKSKIKSKTKSKTKSKIKKLYKDYYDDGRYYQNKYLYKEFAKQQVKEEQKKKELANFRIQKYRLKIKELIQKLNLKKLIITLKVRGSVKYDIPEFLPFYIENSKPDFNNKIYFDISNNLIFKNVKKFFEKRKLDVYNITDTKSLFTNVILYETYLRYIKLLSKKNKKDISIEDRLTMSDVVINDAPEQINSLSSINKDKYGTVNIDIINEEDKINNNKYEDEEVKDINDIVIDKKKITKEEYDTTINNIDYILKSFFNSNNIFNFYNKKYSIHSYLWDEKYKLTIKSNCKIFVTLYVYEEDKIYEKDKKKLFNRELSCKISKDKLYNDFLQLIGYEGDTEKEELKYRIRRKIDKTKRKLPLYDRYQNNRVKYFTPYRYGYK
jgi:tRNA/tmRNA/rRNA uracil-C5-methylase (TrmA/RlmC/RlmD family)